MNNNRSGRQQNSYYGSNSSSSLGKPSNQREYGNKDKWYEPKNYNYEKNCYYNNNDYRGKQAEDRYNNFGNNHNSCTNLNSSSGNHNKNDQRFLYQPEQYNSENRYNNNNLYNGNNVDYKRNNTHGNFSRNVPKNPYEPPRYNSQMNMNNSYSSHSNHNMLSGHSGTSGNSEKRQRGRYDNGFLNSGNIQRSPSAPEQRPSQNRFTPISQPFQRSSPRRSSHSHSLSYREPASPNSPNFQRRYSNELINLQKTGHKDRHNFGQSPKYGSSLTKIEQNKKEIMEELEKEKIEEKKRLDKEEFQNLTVEDAKQRHAEYLQNLYKVEFQLPHFIAKIELPECYGKDEIHKLYRFESKSNDVVFDEDPIEGPKDTVGYKFWLHPNNPNPTYYSKAIQEQSEIKGKSPLRPVF